MAPSKPQVVYANIEAEKGRGLYRSDDGGANWTKLDASNYMVWRPFYFGNLIVDPKDENKIFKPDLILLLSNDGGKSFNVVSGSDHGDFHDVWINPKNPNIVIAGDDGGLWRSEDGGNRWKHQMNLPVSQFYHVSIDNADPYHVYGGLQDNSSWVGDSSYPGGVSNRAGKTCTAATASGCSKTLRSRLTSMPRRRAARSGASTATRTRLAAIKPCRITARRNCASTGTRPFT